jgi:hypothetical protein
MFSRQREKREKGKKQKNVKGRNARGWKRQGGLLERPVSTYLQVKVVERKGRVLTHFGAIF